MGDERTFLDGITFSDGRFVEHADEEILSEIPVDEAIKNALLGLSSQFRPIFDVVLDYES